MAAASAASRAGRCAGLKNFIASEAGGGRVDAVDLSHFRGPIGSQRDRVEPPPANLGEFGRFADQHLLFAQADLGLPVVGHIRGDDNRARRTTSDKSDVFANIQPANAAVWPYDTVLDSKPARSRRVEGAGSQASDFSLIIGVD